MTAFACLVVEAERLAEIRAYQKLTQSHHVRDLLREIDRRRDLSFRASAAEQLRRYKSETQQSDDKLGALNREAEVKEELPP